MEIRNSNHEDIEAFICHETERLKAKFDLGQEPDLTNALRELLFTRASGKLLMPTPSSTVQNVSLIRD